MEESVYNESETSSTSVDIDSIKLDAVIQLRTWQKKMHALIDKTYKHRLHEIESIANDLSHDVEHKTNKVNINVHEVIPDNFEHKIQRTIRISREEFDPDTEIVDNEDEDEDDDDEPVIVDINPHEVHGQDRVVIFAGASEEHSNKAQQGTVARILTSEPIQNAIVSGLVKTIAQLSVVTATSTTTAAATSMAKTAVIATACGVGTVAYGVGRITFGTTKRVWSYFMSSDD